MRVESLDDLRVVPVGSVLVDRIGVAYQVIGLGADWSAHKGERDTRRPGFVQAGIRGVRQRSSGHWWARVRHNGVLHERGPFGTAEEASGVATGMRRTFFTHSDMDRLDGEVA